MSWQVLLVINLIAAVFREALGKRIVNQTHPYILVFYSTLIAIVSFFVLHILFFQRLPQFYLPVFLSGSITALAFLSYNKAVKISLSKSILFQSFSVVVTIILSAFFLGELKYFNVFQKAGQQVLLGLVLAFTSIFLILGYSSKHEEKTNIRWFIYIFITIVFMGLSSFVSVFFVRKYNVVEVLFNQVIMMALTGAFFMKLEKVSFRINFDDFKIIILRMVFDLTAVLAYFWALLSQPVAKFLPLQQTALVIFTVINGVLFFKEKSMLSLARILGVILGIAGIIMISGA